MQVDQYAYFALSSRSTSAAEMTAILGLEPDEVIIRGSRLPGPEAIPILHRWKIVCREPGLCADEQIAHLLERLAPHTAAIAALARRLSIEESGSPAVLEVVRYFNRQAEPHHHAEAPNLLGWHLGREVLDFLHATGAVLDVDEYDMTPDDVEDRPRPS